MKMNHNWSEQEYSGYINGKKVLDKYFRCDSCKVIKVIRARGVTHYLSEDGSIAGRFLNGAPPCLRVIDETDNSI